MASKSDPRLRSLCLDTVCYVSFTRRVTSPLRTSLKSRVSRVVVKLGSGVLSAGKSGLDVATIRRLAREAARLKKEGREVVLVSSGAILAGRERLGMKARPQTTAAKQAAAAVGQGRLMRLWDEAFSKTGLAAAQILLTREDLRHRDRYLNARNTIQELLRLGAVPVINENDTVAVEEIKFGDNDVLSALVAGLCGADLLILLTDQEGLYSADPRVVPDARLIQNVGEGGHGAEIGKAGPDGSGGMASKVGAAKMAATSGIPTVIARGSRRGILKAVLEGQERGTLFEPREAPLAQRKRWLAFASHPKGEIHVDAGARDALSRSARSLLPSGVRQVARSFEAGDVVSLVAEGVEFARGLTNYGSKDLEKIKGKKTVEIEGLLGAKRPDEVVHRDNMALLKP
jgi:glutamate 5-kinase